MKGNAILFPASNKLTELVVQEGAECGHGEHIKRSFRPVHGWLVPRGAVTRDPVDSPPGRTPNIFQGLKKEDSVPLGLGFWQQFTHPRIVLAVLDL